MIKPIIYTGLLIALGISTAASAVSVQFQILNATTQTLTPNGPSILLYYENQDSGFPDGHNCEQQTITSSITNTPISGNNTVGTVSYEFSDYDSACGDLNAILNFSSVTTDAGTQIPTTPSSSVSINSLYSNGSLETGKVAITIGTLQGSTQQVLYWTPIFSAQQKTRK